MSASAASLARPCQPSRSCAIGSTAHSAAATTPASAPHSVRTRANTDVIPIRANTQIPCISTLAGWPPINRYDANTAGVPGSCRNGVPPIQNGLSMSSDPCARIWSAYSTYWPQSLPGTGV